MTFPPQLIPFALLLGVLCLCASCETTNTTPTAAQMDRYYRKAEEMARTQIDMIDDQLRRGVITQEAYDVRLASIRNNIPRQAGELAWARHEISEAQKRQLGIPTGDTAVEMALPNPAGAGGFYKPYGQQSGTGSTAYGSTSGSMWRGYTPGSVAGSLGGSR